MPNDENNENNESGSGTENENIVESSFALEDEITSELRDIKNAIYGSEVRDAIYNALYELATATSAALNLYVSQLGTYVERAESASNEVEGLYSRAQSIYSDLFKSVASYKVLSESISRLTSVAVVRPETAYIQKTISGKTVWESVDPSLAWNPNGQIISIQVPNPTENDANAVTTVEVADGQWQWSIPPAPQFKSLKVNWKNYNAKDVSSFKDALEYNPNSGEMTLSLRNFLSNLEINPNAVSSSQGVSASMWWSNDHFVLNLNLPVIDTNSTSLEGVSHRAFFVPLDTNDQYHTNTKGGNNDRFNFGVTAYVDTTTDYDSSNDKVKELRDYFEGHDEAVFDGAFIVFRKSVDNNDGNNLYVNFGEKEDSATLNKVLFKDNDDYDSTITVFIPRGGDVTASYTDTQGRTFTRRVHWMTEPWVCKCKGDKSGLAETVKYVPKSKAGTVGGVTAATYGEIKNATRSSTMLLFEHAMYNKKGNKVDWAVTSANSDKYTQSVTLAKKSALGKNKVENSIYDQFMIPIQIIGVSYHLSESDIRIKML